MHTDESIPAEITGRRSDSAPGLVQAVGGPLRPGESLDVKPLDADGAQLFVRAYDGSTLVEAVFDRIPVGVN